MVNPLAGFFLVWCFFPLEHHPISKKDTVLGNWQYCVKGSSQSRNSALHIEMVVLLITSMMLSCVRGKLGAFDTSVSSNLQLKLQETLLRYF